MSKAPAAIKYGPLYNRNEGTVAGRAIFRDHGNGNIDVLVWITPSVRHAVASEGSYVPGSPDSCMTNPKEIEKLLRFVQADIENTLATAFALVANNK